MSCLFPHLVMRFSVDVYHVLLLKLVGIANFLDVIQSPSGFLCGNNPVFVLGIRWNHSLLLPAFFSG
ncbi:hypothetical protein P879_11400 [Paragonimus westermani]|uniref:Uncharacterized protein n=1 Tax=Paragonimus westermani TaxID=34504 RepID=A0A8T0D6E3_9TREM|nr:hypothetical protein P879_11400 [Paragonimus westermani]